MVGPGCSAGTQEAKLKEKIPFKFNLVARGVYWGYLYSIGDSSEVALPKCPLQHRWQLRKAASWISLYNLEVKELCLHRNCSHKTLGRGTVTLVRFCIFLILVSVTCVLSPMCFSFP